HEHKTMTSNVMEGMKRRFRPERLKRIDETIVFHSIEKEHMKDIVTVRVKQVKERITEQEINFYITEKAIEKIADDGFDPEYGARALRRSIQRNIEDLLSEEMLKGTIAKGQDVKIGLNSRGDIIVLPK